MACSAPWFKEPPLWERRRRKEEEEEEEEREGRMRQLHGEIVAFYERAKPSQAEKQRRAGAMERVKQIVAGLWPGAEVKVFGSYATGLYLPQTSDIDIAIVEEESARTGTGTGTGTGLGLGLGTGSSSRIGDASSVDPKLEALASALIRSGRASKVQVISRARIPIVKFIEKQSRIAFDVRLNTGMELRAASFIAAASARFPAIAPLYITIKTFLQRKHLNEVYPGGGLASYALFVMLFAFLQVHPHGRDATANPSARSGLGALLAGFFHFYGRSFDVRQYGISCREGYQHFFLKSTKGFLNSWRPYLLAVEDPLLVSNDIGKNSFNFPLVQAAFCEAYELLTSGYFNPPTSSLLSLILNE